jgi:hypothetical protein
MPIIVLWGRDGRFVPMRHELPRLSIIIHGKTVTVVWMRGFTSAAVAKIRTSTFAAMNAIRTTIVLDMSKRVAPAIMRPIPAVPINVALMISASTILGTWEP